MKYRISETDDLRDRLWERLFRLWNGFENRFRMDRLRNGLWNRLSGWLDNRLMNYEV